MHNNAGSMSVYKLYNMLENNLENMLENITLAALLGFKITTRNSLPLHKA